MTKRLLKLKQEIASGFFPDQPAENPILWETGQNVMFMPGFVRPGFGSAIVGEIGFAGAVTELISARIAGVPTGFAFNKQKVVKFTDQDSIWAPTVLGTYSGTDDTIWVGVSWDDWAIFTNDSDPVQVSKAGAAAANLDTDSQFTTARTLLEAGEFVFAFNTNVGNGNDSWWCNKGDPETWLAVSSNLAGDLELRTTNSEIVCAKKLGEVPVYYTEVSMHVLDFVGAPDVWTTRKVQDEIGAAGPHAVVAVGSVHFGFGKKGIWKTNSVDANYIDIGFIHDYIFDDYNEDRLPHVVAAHFKNDDTVVFSYSSEGSTINDRAVAINLTTERWTILGYGFSAAMSAEAFAKDMIGLSTGVLQTIGLPLTAVVSAVYGYGGVNTVGGDDYGYGEGGYGGYDVDTPGQAILQSRPINVPEVADPEGYDDDKVAHLDFVKIEVQSPTTTLTLYVGYRNELGDTTTWDDGQTVSAGSARIYVNVPDMKYFLVKLVDTAPTRSWKLSAIEFHGQVLG